MIREADRLSPAAADTLLKVLEEPPADSVLLLHVGPRARAARHRAVRGATWSRSRRCPSRSSSRCSPARGSTRPAPRLAARLAGGNLGRARRLATAADGLRFREAAERAVALAADGPTGALEAADVVLAAAAEYKKGLKAELETALAPFLDEKGRPEDAYRGAIKRIEVRFHRRERRAERDYIDWELLAVSSLLRDRIAGAVGGGPDLFMNPDLVPDRAVERAPRRTGARRDRGGARRSRGGPQPQPAAAARTGVPASRGARRRLTLVPRTSPRKVVLALLAFARVGWDARTGGPHDRSRLDRR